MDLRFPEPTDARSSRAEVFLGYLDYFRERAIGKVSLLPPAEVVRSRLPSGWSPVELLLHLRHMERRWLEWGFLGREVGDPWADEQHGRWHVPPGVGLAVVVDQLRRQGVRSRDIVEAHRLDERGQPGRRWHGAEPATLERVLFHVMQEYARHLGQLDVGHGNGRRVAARAAQRLRRSESSDARRSTSRPGQPPHREYGMGLIHVELFATLDLVGQSPRGPDEDPASLKGSPRHC